MAVRPELVRHDKLDDFPVAKPAVKILEDPRMYWVRPWHLHVPRSAGGETRTVNMENAKKLQQLNHEWIADIICDLCSVPWSNRYPYE
jgi:hypothetical protein